MQKNGRISKSFEQIKDSFGRIISESFGQTTSYISERDGERERFVNVTDETVYQHTSVAPIFI